jgi:hypothetical protein
MNRKAIRFFLVGVSLAFSSACALDANDPLLFDEEGQPRSSVSFHEVEEAGVVDFCDDLEDVLASSVDVIRVPVIGEEGAPVLIGVGGLALCLDEEDDEKGELEGLVIGEQTDPEGSGAIGGETSADDTAKVGVRPRDNPSGALNEPRPRLISDPTPEPASD